MSNPGVIILDNESSNKGKINRFVVEDNIGESIHLHIDDMRVDFTIDEFLTFSDAIRESLDSIDFLCGYKLSQFDEYFLKECSPYLPRLKKIEIEDIELSKLICVVHSNYHSDFNFLKLVPVALCPAYRFLTGNGNEFLEYEQYNYYNVNNEHRLLELSESVQKNGYPSDGRYIVLFNGQDVIRDGQHRAAILANLLGEQEKVKVMRFYFNEEKHLIHIHKSNILALIKWAAKKVYRSARLRAFYRRFRRLLWKRNG
jgi:hypothetical protein